MSRTELRRSICELRSVLGETLQMKQVDVIALPASDLVLKKSSSESKKTITVKKLLSAFEAVFTAHQGTDLNSADLTIAVQQNLRQSITTVRHYGDVLEASSAAARRKPRGVAELQSGTFGPSDTETVQLCQDLARVKQQLAALPRGEKAGEACNEGTKSQLRDPGGNSETGEAPSKAQKCTKRSFKVFEANILIDNICTAIMSGRLRVPSWGSASEQVEGLINTELRG